MIVGPGRVGVVPVRGLVLAALVDWDHASAIPDSNLNAADVQGWRADLRWVLRRIWSPTTTSSALVAVDYGGVVTEPLSLPASGGTGVELWIPAPPAWSGPLIVRTTTAQVVELTSSGAYAGKGWHLGWASTGAQVLQIEWWGFERAESAC